MTSLDVLGLLNTPLPEGFLGRPAEPVHHSVRRRGAARGENVFQEFHAFLSRSDERPSQNLPNLFCVTFTMSNTQTLQVWNICLH